MTPRHRLMEYLLYTSFIWGMYLVWLIPFQHWVVGMPWSMVETWLFWGTISEMFAAYPIGKIYIKGTPKITEWVLKH